MKVVFSVNDGRIKATNSNVFKSFFLSENDLTVADNSFSQVTKWMYAVIDSKPIRVFVVSAKTGIKLMFEISKNNLVRMFIEDGDVLYTTREDAEIAIKKEQLKKKANETVESINDRAKKISDDINKKFNEVDWDGMFKTFNESVNSVFADFKDDFNNLLDSYAKKKSADEIVEDKNDAEAESTTETVSESVEEKKKRLISERMSLLSKIKQLNKEISALEQ